MINRCLSSTENEILSYIGDCYSSCLYLYLNLKKYGIGSDEIEVYKQVDTDNRITSVLLKYYSCLHVYSATGNFDAAELGAFIEKNQLSMVYCVTRTAESIFNGLPQRILNVSSLTTGWVAMLEKIDKEPQGLATIAQDSDFEQIVQLIYNDDDIGRSYKYTELAQQLKERYYSGYSRNIVIKSDSTVIAHACTNAESDNIAVVAELLVHKEYRRKGYASEIWRDLCNRLLKENKEVYSFYYSNESRALHKKIGFTEVCEWGKIVISTNCEKN